MFSFYISPSIPSDRDQPTKFYTLEGVQYLVRVGMGYLVGTLEGDTHQDQLVPTKVIISPPWYLVVGYWLGNVTLFSTSLITVLLLRACYVAQNSEGNVCIIHNLCFPPPIPTHPPYLFICQELW